MSCAQLIAELPECRDSILLKFAFEPTTEYVVKITDRYGHTYTNTYTSDSDGNITILASDYPVGLFNRYAGLFTLKMYESDGCTPKSIVMCAQDYDDIKLEFHREDNDDTDAVVECCAEPDPE